MKKIISVVMGIILTLSLASCAAQDLRVSFDEIAPWSTATGYEKSTYKIERYTRVASGKEMVDGVLIASGEYTTTILSVGDAFEATATFSLTYNDSPEAITVIDKNSKIDNRGLTDTFTSIAKFNKGQVPTYAEKTWKCAVRPEGSNQLNAYSYTADYNAGKASVTCGEQTKEIALAGGTKYDNEQLNYVVRAMSAINAGATADFYNVNLYDSFLTGNYTRYQMRATCNKTTTGITNDNINKTKFMIKDKEGEIKSAENGAYNIPCIETSVSLSAKNSGPAIKLTITDPSVLITERKLISGDADTLNYTKKIIVAMRYLEYDVPAAKEQFSTLYTLTNYQITPTK